MKYRPSIKLCRWAGQQLAESLRELFGNTDWDLIVPIPSEPKSLRARGFNQCLLMAAECQVRLSKTQMTPFALLHQGYKHAQASLAPGRRLSNVRHAFLARPWVAEKRILLVEDLVTTGATINCATWALLQAGAASVDVIALTRSHTNFEFRQELHQAFKSYSSTNSTACGSR